MKEKSGNLHCVRCPFVNYRNPRPTVTAIILHKDKILLTKRSIDPFKGRWDLPGGFMKNGETPAQALKREIKEELNLGIKIKKFIGAYPGVYPARFDPCYTLNNVFVVIPVGIRNLMRDKGEIGEIAWFSKEDSIRLIKKIAFDGDRKAFKFFLKIWKN